MKKMILSTAALLTIVSLAACSNKQDTKKDTSNSQSTTKVTSKSATTSKSKDTSTDLEDTSTSSLLTDDESVKQNSRRLQKVICKSNGPICFSYWRSRCFCNRFCKEQYDATISALKEKLESQKEIFYKGLDSIGLNGDVVPKEDREALIERLKDTRDELESTRKELKDMQKEFG